MHPSKNTSLVGDGLAPASLPVPTNRTTARVAPTKFQFEKGFGMRDILISHFTAEIILAHRENPVASTTPTPESDYQHTVESLELLQ